MLIDAARRGRGRAPPRGRRLGLRRAGDGGEDRARASSTDSRRGRRRARAALTAASRAVGAGPERGRDRPPRQDAPEVGPIEDRQPVEPRLGAAARGRRSSDSSGPTSASSASRPSRPRSASTASCGWGTARSWAAPTIPTSVVRQEHGQRRPEPSRRGSPPERVERELRRDRLDLLLHRLADADAGDQPVEDQPAVDGAGGRHEEPADEPEHDPVERCSSPVRITARPTTMSIRPTPRPTDRRSLRSGRASPTRAQPIARTTPPAVERERRDEADAGQNEVQRADDHKHVGDRAECRSALRASAGRARQPRRRSPSS